MLSMWHSLFQEDTCTYTLMRLFSQALVSGRATSSSNSLYVDNTLKIFTHVTPICFPTSLMKEGEQNKFQFTNDETKVQKGEVISRGCTTKRRWSWDKNTHLLVDVQMPSAPTTCTQAPVLSSEPLSAVGRPKGKPSSLYSQPHFQDLRSFTQLLLCP